MSVESPNVETNAKPARFKILKTVLRIGITIAITALFLNSPRLYKAPIKASEHVTCTNEKVGGYTASTIEDVVLGHSIAQQPKVGLDGTIAYSPANDTFYLRDGAFIIPLDVTGCETFDMYKRGDVLVFIKGTASIKDGRSQLAIDGIHRSAPAWAQIIYNAGVFIAFGLAFWVLLMILKGLVMFVRWLMVLIGLRQPKKPTVQKNPEEIKERYAGLSLLAGICGPILWLINPVFGALYQGYGIYLGWQGFHSHKRTVATVGLILCVVGFIIMPPLLSSLGLFAKIPEPNFFHSTIEAF